MELSRASQPEHRQSNCREVQGFAGAHMENLGSAPTTLRLWEKPVVQPNTLQQASWARSATADTISALRPGLGSGFPAGTRVGPLGSTARAQLALEGASPPSAARSSP